MQKIRVIPRYFFEGTSILSLNLYLSSKLPRVSTRMQHPVLHINYALIDFCIYDLLIICLFYSPPKSKADAEAGSSRDCSMLSFNDEFSFVAPPAEFNQKVKIKLLCGRAFALEILGSLKILGSNLTRGAMLEITAERVL